MGQLWHPQSTIIIIYISIIKILSSLNTTICFDVIKKEKQLHVSARGHRQVGSFGFARKNAFCNALLIYNDWRGDRDLVLQSVGVFLACAGRVKCLMLVR
jgi:hypothetical protein